MRFLSLKGVRQNNLKNVSLDLPLETAIIVTGPSGSGKSSLAFETIYAEGQRRYMQSLSTYARQFLEKFRAPLLDSIENIPPSIALEQINPVRNSRATVGTTTEIYDYLRLLFEKIGKPFCEKCKIPMVRWSYGEYIDYLFEKFNGQTLLLGFEKSFTPKADQTKLILEEMLRAGFSRILWKNEVIRLEDFLKEVPESLGSVHVVVDRITLPKEKTQIKEVQNRVTEGLQTAQKLGLGTGLVFSLAKLESPPIPFTLDVHCPQCFQRGVHFSSLTFSFNSPMGACVECKGFGNILEVDEKKAIPNPEMSIQRGAIDPLTKPSLKTFQKKMFQFCKEFKIDTTVSYQDLSAEHKDWLYNGHKKFIGLRGVFKELEKDKYKMGVRIFINRYQSAFTCKACGGDRLKKEALSIRVAGKSISEISRLSLVEIEQMLKSLLLTAADKTIAQDVIAQLSRRLEYLNTIGLGYLTLARATRTLSGGEYQRILLSTQLSQGLTDTLYVLDEPSIGLHPKDTAQLIKVLKKLRELGNTLVVVEHDPEMIEWGEHIVDMGPGSGMRGGDVVFNGSHEEFFKSETLTANAVKDWRLDCQRAINLPRSLPTKGKLIVRGATENNLKNVDLEIPLNHFVVVTGVSGSGKSTLIVDTLYPALLKALRLGTIQAGEFQRIEGAQNLAKVELVDQSPIGKSSRSNPVTFIKAYDEIRHLFAATKEAREKIILPGDFSFNVVGGRCDTCEGEGRIHIDMQFMEDVWVPCDVCNEKRFKPHILAIQFLGKNIHDVLEMTIDEASLFFKAQPALKNKLSFLQQVGLGYLKLGQAGNSLSGGEAQRIKIARTLATPSKEKTLFILDEPTTGLHFSEVSKLIYVLKKLLEEGHTVVVIEHNLQLISHADHVIDLGPEGGLEGGYILAQGTPAEVARQNISYTSSILHQLAN